MNATTMMVLIFTALFILSGINAQTCVMTSDNIERKIAGAIAYPSKPHTEFTMLEEEARILLAKTCGEYPVNRTETFGVCCSSKQVETLSKNLKSIDIVLSSCPACGKSFKNMFCDFTCSPNQNKFITIDKFYSEPELKEYIEVVKLQLSKYYQEKVWDTCRLNKLATGVTLQQQYKVLQAFLADLVETRDSSPKIQYSYASDQQGFNATVVGCRDICFCAYCAECIDGKGISADYSCKVFSMPCLHVGFIVMGIVLGLFVAALVFALIMRLVYWRTSKREQYIEYTDSTVTSSINPVVATYRKY